MNVKALALTTAMNELKDSMKAVQEAQQVLLGTSVFSKKFAEVQDKFVKAQTALAINSQEYVEMNTDKVFEEVDVNFNTKLIDGLVDEALFASGEYDKEEAYNARCIYILIKLIQLYKGYMAASKFNKQLFAGGVNDVAVQYEERFRNLVHALVLGTWTKGTMLTPYMQIFGGKLGATIVQPVDAFNFESGIEELGIDLSDIRTAFGKMALYFDSSFVSQKERYKVLVEADQISFFEHAIKIRMFKDVCVTMSWEDFYTKAKMLDQTLMICIAKDGGTDALGRPTMVATEVGTRLNAFQRIAALHVSGVDLDGLKDDPTAVAVINCGTRMSAKGLSTCSVVKVPFQGMIADGKMTPELAAINTLLTSESSKWVPILNAEQYGRQGFITKSGTYVSEANAFCTAEGESFEGASKLLARLQKLALNKSMYKFKARNIIVAPALFNLVLKEIKADPGKRAPSAIAQSEFSECLARSLVAGNDVASEALTDKVGVVRIVSGKDVDASGQKAMLGRFERMNTASIETVADTIPNFQTSQALISGLNSTKSSVFKKSSDGWTLVQGDYKGQVVYFYVKEVVEEFQITDSATASAYELVEQEKLTGVEAAVDLLQRRIFGKTSMTIMERVYGEEALAFGEGVVERIQAMEAAGLIRKKAIKNKTNSQLNSGLEFQFGKEFAEKALEFWIKQNDAIGYRQKVSAASIIQNGANFGVAVVDGQQLIRDLALRCYAAGVENVKSSVWPTTVVANLVRTLARTNSPVVVLDFGNDQSVAIPVLQSMLDDIEEIGRINYVRVGGLLSEILQAVGHSVLQALSKAKVDTDGCPELVGTSVKAAGVAVIMDKIAKARDRAFGKKLNQIPTIGTNVFLLTSGKLKGNEIVSGKVQEASRKAERAYGCDVVGLLTKPPVLWLGSISAVKIVFTRFTERDDILEGMSAYISPEKALGNGNDADGDRLAVDFLPKYITALDARLSPEWYIDARDESIAAGGRFYSNFWKEEMAGMYYTPGKAPSVQVTADQFEQSIVSAVFKAAYSKTNVAIYTTHGATTLAWKQVWLEAAKKAIKNLNSLYKDEVHGMQVADMLADEVKLNAVVEALHRFTVDVQNACVNFDAMDQIKSDTGADTKKLAELLSPWTLSFMSPEFIKLKEGEDAGKASIRAIKQTITTLVGTMFKGSHNISYAQLNNIIPSTAGQTKIWFFLTYVMAYAGMKVGVANRTSFCKWNSMAKDLKDTHITMESLLAEKASKTYVTNTGEEFNCNEDTTLSSTASYILQTAIKFANYKYIAEA